MLPDDEIEEEDEPEQSEPNAIETEARSMGWVPKEEFRGPESQWRDAEEFVERGHNVLPIVNSLLKKEREKNSKLETKYEKFRAESEENFKRLERMSTTALEKQREQLTAQYEAKKEAAVERGDMDAYRAADKAEKVALSDLDAKAKPEPQADPGIPNDYQVAIRDFYLDNEWAREGDLAAVVNAEHVRLMTIAPIKTVDDLKDNLARAVKFVKKHYPEKFLNEEDKPNRASRVEGGSRTSGGGGNSLYSKLPTEAKQIADKQIDLYLKPGETAEKDGLRAKERWAKVYWDQPGV